MDPRALLRKVHQYGQEDFQAIWASVRELALIETLDNAGKAQGQALVSMDQLYKADADGSFAKVSYIACSDEYYQWWVDHDMGANVFHHFCRHGTLKGCMEKVGKEGLVHVLQWAPVTRPEGEKILREWGFSPTLLGRSLKSLPPWAEADRGEGHTTSKASPVRPPPGLDRDRSPALRLRPRTQAVREEEPEYDEAPGDRRTRKSRMAQPVTPPRGQHKKHRPKDSGGAALDKMLEEDPFDADSDKLRGEAHDRLASLRDQLQQKKQAKSKAEPGAILATRAAEVAETSGRKRKKHGDKVINALTKALKKKGVKEEPDYGDDMDRSDSEDDSESEEDEKELLGGSKGSSGAAVKQRKLRQFSEKKPGKLLQMGYESMHEQMGTYFGRDDNKKEVLTPIALRYLLSYALPQIRGGISHDKYRELRTLATCLDQLVAGQTGQAGDLLLQRYKALLMCQRDGSDAASRYIELLPEEEMPTMASSQESYLARSLAVHQAKSEELLRRAST